VLPVNPGGLESVVDDGLVGGDVPGVLVLPERPLDILGEVGVSGLPARAGGVLPWGHPETVMIGVGLTDVRRLNLGDLQGAQPDKSAQLEHHIVPV